MSHVHDDDDDYDEKQETDSKSIFYTPERDEDTEYKYPENDTPFMRQSVDYITEQLSGLRMVSTDVFMTRVANLSHHVDEKSKTRIQLLPHQVDHAQRVSAIHKLHPSYVDGSDMGTGKTELTSYQAQQNEAVMLVVAPKTVASVWERIYKTYGVPILDILSYETLRGSTNQPLSHPFLTRRDTPCVVKRAQKRNQKKEEKYDEHRSMILSEFHKNVEKADNENTYTQSQLGDIDQTKEEKTKYTTDFQVTEFFKQWCNRPGGIYLVLDEIQRAKNDTPQSWACATLAHYICTLRQSHPNNKSRVIFLSATMFDKMDHAPQMARCMGLLPIADHKMEHASLVVFRNGLVEMCKRDPTSQPEEVKHNHFESKSQQEIKRSSKTQKSKPTKSSNRRGKPVKTLDNSLEAMKQQSLPMTEAERLFFSRDVPRHKKHICEWMYDGIMSVVHPRLFSFMDSPNIPFALDVRNAYIAVDDQLADTIEDLLQQLKKAVRNMDVNGWQSASNAASGSAAAGGSADKIEQGLVFKLMQKIEYYKVPILMQLSHLLLALFPNLKIVLAVWYTESIHTIGRYFEQLNIPMLDLHGQQSAAARKQNIDKFNAPDLNHRLLVANIVVASCGLSLHDTDGRFPRITLAIPSFRVIDMHQLTKRIHRVHLKSQATTIFIHVRRANAKRSILLESNLLSSYARKSKVLSRLSTAKYLHHTIQYPDQYPTCTIALVLTVPWDVRKLVQTSVEQLRWIPYSIEGME